ncbi:MAG: AAA family ATPase [Saprospiraceae bacterium]
MILKSLQLKNFKQYSELELDFREGLVGIVGRNGAGKSSIFEAVLVCLYGFIPSKEFIRSSWAGDKDHVLLELVFEIDQKTYLAKREFKGKTLTHHAGLYNHKNTMIATGAKPVNEEVSKLIGMDKDAFTRSIFSGQKELGELSNTKGEERRRMVRKMVGLEKLDDIQRIIRKDRNSLKEQIKGQRSLLLSEETQKAHTIQLKSLQTDKSVALEQQTQLEKELANRTSAYQQAKTDYTQQQARYVQYNELNQNLIRFQKAVENFQTQTEERTAEQSKLRELQTKLSVEAPKFHTYEAQKLQLKQLEKDKASFDQLKQLQLSQQHLQERATEVQNQVKALETALQEQAPLQARATILTTELQKVQTNQEATQKQLNALTAQRGSIQGKVQERDQSIQAIENLGKEATCPTCFRPLLDAYEGILENLKTELNSYQQKDLLQLNSTVEKIKSEYNLFKEKEKTINQEKQKLSGHLQVLASKNEQLNALRQQQAQLQTQLATLIDKIKQMGAVQFDTQAYSDLRKTLEALEQDYINYQKQLRETEKIPELTEKISALQIRIEKGQLTIKEQEQSIQALQFSLAHYQQAQRAQQEKEDAKDKAQQQLKAHQASFTQLDRQILQLQNLLDTHQQTLQVIAQNSQELTQLEALDNIFSEFKTTILDRVKPTISYNASQLFQQITKGRYEGIKVDDNFEFHITEDGKDYPITRFSGGEVDLANLCLRIGISRAIAELSGNSSGISFLGFDEIFGSQDEERRFEILLALDLLKEQYRQIYIISHIDTVKEHFPSILEIRNTAKGSSVNWL